MAASNATDRETTLNGHAQGDGFPHAWPNADIGLIDPGGDWRNTTDGVTPGSSGVFPLWVQGAPPSAQHWSAPAEAGDQADARLVVFGDLLADNGNTAAVEKALGQTPSYLTAPYSSTGDFSDGPKWTTGLARSFGLQQDNYAYQGATGGTLGDAYNPVNPAGGLSPLDTFAGQIQQFENKDGSFSPDDVVSVTFGGNDVFLASADELAGTASSAQVITDSVNAIISGLGQLADLGAKHFLISNSPDVTLAPILSSAEFLASGATVGGVQGLVNDFNTQLATGLDTFGKQTGLDVKTLDLHSLFDGIVADPSRYGFANVTQPVLSSLPGTGTSPVYNPAINGQDPRVEHGSLFIDPLFDTTTRAQTLIAQTAHGTLLG